MTFPTALSRFVFLGLYNDTMINTQIIEGFHHKALCTPDVKAELV